MRASWDLIKNIGEPKGPKYQIMKAWILHPRHFQIFISQIHLIFTLFTSLHRFMLSFQLVSLNTFKTGPVYFQVLESQKKNTDSNPPVTGMELTKTRTEVSKVLKSDLWGSLGLRFLPVASRGLTMSCLGT